MKLDPERVAGFIADIRRSHSRLNIIGAMPEEEFLADLADLETFVQTVVRFL